MAHHTYNVRVENKKLPPNASRADWIRSTQTLLRILKRACTEADISHDFKEHEYFVRKTDKKRRKKMIKLHGAQEGPKPETNREREQWQNDCKF